MRGHYHFLEIQPRSGGRWGARIDREQDRPTAPFVIYSGTDGRRVVIPPGFYSWNYWSLEYFQQPVGAVQLLGGPHLRLLLRRRLDAGGRQPRGPASAIGSRPASATPQADVELPYGNFVTKLVPTKVSYSFTPLATLARWCSTTRRPARVNSNIRLALLNRSGTGLFIVYNDLRDTSADTRSYRGLDLENSLLGRSFIVKYTRLFDF